MTQPIQPADTRSFSLIDFIKSLPAKIKQLAQKTYRAVASVFSSLAELCSPGTLLTRREIQWLRREKKYTPPIQLGRAEPIIPKPQNTPSSDPSSELTKDVPAEETPTSKSFDPSLEELRTFAREFAALAVDETYNIHIAGKIDAVQTIAPSLPPVIKSLAKLFVEMGDKAAKPLFQKFASQKAQMVDPTLRKIFKMLMKPDLLLLREDLSSHLHLLLKETSPGGEDSYADLVVSIVEWTALPEGQRPPIANAVPAGKGCSRAMIEAAGNEALKFWNERHNDERTSLYKTLLEQIKEEFIETDIPAKQQLDRDYIEPCLSWLLLSNQTTPLYSLFIPEGRFSEDLIDKIFERSITLLVERKIDHFAQLLEKTMQRRLGEITQHVMEINAVRIADFLSERIASLIEATPFTETADEVIKEVLRSQIEGVIAAQNEMEFHRRLLEKTKKTALSDAKKPAEVAAKEAAINHLAIVEQHGSEEKFLEIKRLEAFSREPACTPTMKEMITQTIELTLQGKDPSGIQRASEKAIFDAIGEKLLDLMMPVKKALNSENEIVETDPFTELWDQLYFPQEFKDLIKHSDELTSEFITPDTMALLGHIKQPVIEIAKNLFKTASKDLLRKQLGIFVQKGIGLVTNGDSLDELTATAILPTLNKKMIAIFARQEIERNNKIFLPLLQKMMAANPAEREGHKRQLFFALSKHVREKFHHFDPQKFALVDDLKATNGVGMAEVSALDWIHLLLPVVDDIEKGLSTTCMEGNPCLTPKQVEDAMKTAFKSKPVENMPVLGKIVMDVVFRLGEMNSEWIVNWFAKDALSLAATEILQPWRMSHELLVSTIISSLQNKYLASDAIKRLISSDPSIPTQHVKAKLEHQIDVTARLAHDMIFAMTEQNGVLATYALKKILTDKPDMIDGQIQMIYSKLLGNRIENENLVTRCFDSVLSGMTKAAETLRLRENIRIQQLAAK